MGADAEVWLFDYERYRDEIVPALVDLLRGDVADWLGEIFRRAESQGGWGYDAGWLRMAQLARERPADPGHLGDDLRCLGETPAPQLPRRFVACSHGAGCFFHDNDAGGPEGFNALHEALVSTRCLSSSRFVGRTVSPDFYRPLLERWGVPDDDPVRGLLDALGARGAIVGYQWEASSGTLGWLTGAETRDLAERLDRLDLPRYEPTFAAMAELHTRSLNSHGTAEDWEALSLSFVRTTAGIAAERGLGVLWGNDVTPGLWADQGLGFHYGSPWIAAARARDGGSL
ncbi:hypothetical protein KOI35_44090 [Actinoplanes bogorensis]|uniref:Uncharacterized protein n=1 Tax=Paractinoplanes bogorensis TaxID=1610840 RepID=A0ABS5Z6E4_9ACTN|nr:hypothetical protein [Actinoplanes bogorensis]MBU2670504.1 hypothetical protein [Actinoplanes bogorensis]